MRQNRVTRFLRLRLEHEADRRADLCLPDPDVAGSARPGRRSQLPKLAGLPADETTFVNGAPQEAHPDPFVAPPRSNEFLKTAKRCLRRTFKGGD
jgi:hypothetical protein